MLSVINMNKRWRRRYRLGKNYTVNVMLHYETAHLRTLVRHRPAVLVGRRRQLSVGVL